MEGVLVGIVTIIAIPSLGWYLTRLINQRDVSDSNERRMWQRGAIERHANLVKRVEAIQKCMQEVKISLNQKLDIEDFQRESEEKWSRMNHHEHLIECDSEACTAKKTSGVII